MVGRNGDRFSRVLISSREQSEGGFTGLVRPADYQGGVTVDG
jgi:hypothetical protein